MINAINERIVIMKGEAEEIRETIKRKMKDDTCDDYEGYQEACREVYQYISGRIDSYNRIIKEIDKIKEEYKEDIVDDDKDKECIIDKELMAAIKEKLYEINAEICGREAEKGNVFNYDVYKERWCTEYEDGDLIFIRPIVEHEYDTFYYVYNSEDLIKYLKVCGYSDMMIEIKIEEYKRREKEFYNNKEKEKKEE